MKANELRIGNWVKIIFQNTQYGTKVDYLQVKEICFDYTYTGELDIGSQLLKDCQPIELTPEILEKCGFEKYEPDMDYEDYDFFVKYCDDEKDFVSATVISKDGH